MLSIIIVVVSVLIECCIAGRISVAGIKPDFVLIAIIWLALRFGSQRGAILGAIGGASIDLLSGGIMGTSIFTRTIAGFLAGTLSKRIYTDHTPTILIVVGAVSIVSESLYAVLHLILEENFQAKTLPIILSSSIYTVLVTPFVLYPFRKKRRRESFA